MSDQPYAPPASMAAPAFGDTELPRTSVVLMVLLTLATLGLYIPFWFLRRRKVLNRLAGEGDSVNALTFALVAAYAVAFAIGFLSGVQHSTGGPLASSPWVRVVNIGSRILTLVVAFKVKFILEANYPDRISGLGTFFLSIFYLQYKINRLGEVDPVAERFTLR